MSEKKILSNWRLGLTFTLGAGLVASIIMKLAMFLLALLGFKDGSALLNQAVSLIVWIIVLPVGIIAISAYLNRRYIIKDKKNVLKFGSIIYIVLYVIFLLFYFLRILSYIQNIRVMIVYLLLPVSALPFIVCLFYFLGRRYIKETTQKNKP